MAEFERCTGLMVRSRMRGWKQQRIQEWLDRLTRVHTEERIEALLDAWSKVLTLEGKLK